MAKVIYPLPRPRADQRRTGYRHRHRQRQHQALARQPQRKRPISPPPDKPIITPGALDDVESFTGPLVNGQNRNDNRPA